MDDETTDDVIDGGGGTAARITTPSNYDDKFVIMSCYVNSTSLSSMFSSDTIPTKESSHHSTNATSSVVENSNTGFQCSNDSDEHPVTPPPSYSEAISQAPEASDLSNEDDRLNNKDASSATNPLWYHEGPSSSNKVEDEPSEEELITAALRNVF